MGLDKDFLKKNGVHWVPTDETPVMKGYTKCLWCICKCGKKRLIPEQNLKQLKSKQCRACSETTHGKSYTRLYNIWKGMHQRCENPEATCYENYGGRGITIEWNKFKDFYEWSLANGYSENLSIDRKNNNGNYSPENCRWATQKTQANNTRRNVLVEYKGKILNLKQWSEELGLHRGMLNSRYRKGLRDGELFAPSEKTSKYVGVSYRPDSGYWRARAKIKGKWLSIGQAKTEEEAAELLRNLRNPV